MRDGGQRLWGAFMIQGDGMSVYYSGDTGYSQHFSEIPELFGAPDYALVGIGAYKPVRQTDFQLLRCTTFCFHRVLMRTQDSQQLSKELHRLMRRRFALWKYCISGVVGLTFIKI